MRILIITREKEALKSFVEYSKAEVYWADGFDNGDRRTREEKPDFILIDADLPNQQGIDLLRKIRQSSRVPIVLLGQAPDLSQKISGLKLGADDYLCKACDPRELLVRMEVIVRRSNNSVSTVNVLSYRGLEINLQNRSVRVDGSVVSLGSLEFEALKIFAEQPGRVLSREELTKLLYGPQANEVSRWIDVLLSRLRQKLNDDRKNPRFFRTIRHEGYVFIAEAESVTGPDNA